MDNERDALKRRAAEYAVDFVSPGMILGLGHGSTARFALEKIARLLREGWLGDIRAIPCSSQVEREARRLGIPLTTLDDTPRIDLTIDGADEVTPALELIKGGGGALLREKIVAQASRREIIAVEDTKVSAHLGQHSRVPVEVIPFGWRTQADYLEELGALLTLRAAADGAPFRTEQGNYILDCDFGIIHHPAQLAARLRERAGIVEHGLFLGLATCVVVAGVEGVRLLMAAE